jgi:hypothetical protein
MTNVVDSVPEQFRALFVEVIGEKDEELLTRLRTGTEPSREDRRRVEKLLGSEVMRELSGPDWEPTERGQALKRTVEEFLWLWPIEREGGTR